MLPKQQYAQTFFHGKLAGKAQTFRASRTMTPLGPSVSSDTQPCRVEPCGLGFDCGWALKSWLCLNLQDWPSSLDGLARLWDLLLILAVLCGTEAVHYSFLLSAVAWGRGNRRLSGYIARLAGGYSWHAALSEISLDPSLHTFQCVDL